ncbi:aspartate ammonia-lyase [uncultured Oscillibacter sp.]|uniref:aspartate ammonia-lyase n=1 Tax=uncultured Oscillibacter sp. TaxID=876091 RepID=UPI00261E2F7C|nr:aspartate ammonia-lyase [uncultured Oscillibacter sp.]
MKEEKALGAEELQTRIESDSIGEKKVPAAAYYGVQSMRALENFPITGTRLHKEMIRSLAMLKKACATANQTAGVLDEKTAAAIIHACDKICDGQFHDQFIVDPIQGSAGTSMNMNANEVIANIAIELLGGQKGDYALVHPNDHVNCGQSTNDVIPTAGKMATLVLMDSLERSLEALYESFEQKAREFNDILKMGRTQLQDAVPIRLGQEFHAYATAVARGLRRIHRAEEDLLTINMGGTAIGTGLNADESYFKSIAATLSAYTGRPFRQAEDLIDATQNVDCFASVSSAVRNCAIALSKIANDLRLMSSGPRTGFGEINLPAKQNGSSIMPGKVNPVIPEVINQVAFKIAGNDTTISMAVEAGQLELNAFEPVIFYALFQSIDELDHAVRTFTTNCVDGITVNKQRCQELLDASVGMITALCPYIGYTQAAQLAKEALSTKVPVRKLVLDKGILSKEKLDAILDAYEMTCPGISGKETAELVGA